MRKLTSITLLIIAGFFFYIVGLLSFINDPAIANGKWWVMLGFTIPALIALNAGLALKKFESWKKTTGIVLLSSFAMLILVVFTLACTLMTPEFKAMMKPATINAFSDYTSGGVVTFMLGGIGWLLLKMDAKPQ